jgi:hypothetical protein
MDVLADSWLAKNHFRSQAGPGERTMGAFRNNVGKIKFRKLIKRHIRTLSEYGMLMHRAVHGHPVFMIWQ